MGFIGFDAFHSYNGLGANTGLSSGWSYLSASTSSSLVSGRFGGQAYRLTCDASNNRGILKTLPAAGSTITIGFPIRVTSMPSTTPETHILGVRSGSTYMCGIRISPSGEIIAGRFTSLTASTDLGTSAGGVILVNTWHWVVVTFVIHDTTGSISVTVDGTNVLNLTNVDTRNGTPTTVDTVCIFNRQGTVYGTYEIDCLAYRDDATVFDDGKVDVLPPTSDVAQGFARSAGAVNYSLVDEVLPNGDTDYVQGSTVGDVDTYGFTDLPTTPANVYAAKFVAYGIKTDATARSIALQCKSGGTTDDGPNIALLASYSRLERLLLVDPDTSAAWTASGINAVQGGPKVTV